MTPSLKEILRHRNDVCEDCGEPGILVDSLTCDGDGIVVVRLPSGGGVDLIVAGIPGRTFLRIGDDGSDPLCRDCDRARCEKSVSCCLEGNEL